MLGDGVGDASASELSFGEALADGDGIGESVGCVFGLGGYRAIRGLIP